MLLTMKIIGLGIIILAVVVFACTSGPGTPTPTRDLEATARTAVATALPPTPTPNIDATVRAGVAATVSAIPTPTPAPSPTKTPIPTATPIPVATFPSNLPTFKIGVLESLTGPGELYGIMGVQAKQMAVDEINTSGGINGRMLELIVEDEKCNGQDAITAYNKLTDVDGVKIILGTTCSGALLGPAPLAEEDGVVLLSAMATNPRITRAGDYIFRTAISDTMVGVHTGNVLWVDGHRTLATISEATDYAELLRRTTVERFEELGGSLVSEERYYSDDMDFRGYLTRLFTANPDALHVSAQSEYPGGLIIKQARELGWHGPIYSGEVNVLPTALEVSGDAATGTKAILADIDPGNYRAWKVVRNFKTRYGNPAFPWYMASTSCGIGLCSSLRIRSTRSRPFTLDPDGPRPSTLTRLPA